MKTNISFGIAILCGAVMFGVGGLAIPAASAQSTTADVSTRLDSPGKQTGCEHVRRDASAGGRDVLVCDGDVVSEMRRRWAAGPYDGGDTEEGATGDSEE